MNVATLASPPAAVEQAMQLIESLDDCLLVGCARLGSQHIATLDKLAATCGGSPLAQPVADATAALGRSEFLTTHFVAIAAARVALQGAQHDALLEQARDVLGLAAPELADTPAASPGQFAAILASTQQWLMELALAGFKHLAEDSVAPFMASLERLQAAPELTGLAVLLTGFVNELLAHMPTERQTSLPVFRWSDMWAAAMVRTQQLPGTPPFRQVDGIFTPFGVDVRSHENFVCASTYGILATNDGRQTVRVPLSSYKVDVIAGPEIWELFGDVADPILKALESRKSLALQSAELWSGGDLILKSKPRLGKAADPFAAAEQITAFPAPHPLYRHPVHIAQPVHLQGPVELPLALERLGHESELRDKTLNDVQQMIGLLRFDQGGWRIQPLAIRGKKADVLNGESLLQQRSKLKTKTLPVLQERASKLLRGS